MIVISYTYSVTELGRELGNIIGAPYSLALTECKNEPGKLPLGEYMWSSNYTRAHFRRNVTVPRGFTRVLALFECDNRFEIFINGKVAYDSLGSFKIGERVNCGVLDLTEFFVEGENKIAIRAYMSGSYERFLSALRGTFAIYCGDEVTYIKTDKNYFYARVCNFWANKEDEGWETDDNPQSKWNVDLYPIHPHAMRRSFYVKKDFEAKKGLTRAVLRATAFGLYEPYLNGECVTDERFLPGAMEGCKEYREFDVTEYIKEGKNTVGAIVANGWYNCTAYGIISMKRLGFAAELVLEYGDETEIIPTDKSWLCALSPLYEDDLQFGERYDANLEIPDWCCPGCQSSSFVNAEELELKCKSFVLQSYPSVKVTKTLSPVKKWDLGDNRIIFDFGSNNAARGRLTVKGTKKGDVFRIRYAERLTEGEPHLGVYGDVYYVSDTYRNGTAMGAQRNCDRYVCRGGDREIYEPKFTYTGFRYIYVEYPEGFDAENIYAEARVIHNDLEECGEVHTSSPLSHIWEMICRSFRSNTVGGPTDCPTREKNFWNGDIQAFCITAMWYCNVNDFLSRWTHMGRKIEKNVYGWEDEEYILPYKLYKFYGNMEILKAKYNEMLSLIERREVAYAEHGGFPERSARYRDHLSIVNVSHDFFAFCWHAYMYALVGEISDILGEKEKAAELYQKFDEWKKRFNDTYYIAEENDYSEHCQSGIILPIMLRLCDEKNIPGLVERLVEYIERDKGPTTGFFTTEQLLMVLSENGYRDTAHDIMTRDTFPSWLHLWKTGSTTITESWYGEAAPYDESMNHYAFGSVGRYFFESLGGLKNHSLDMRHFDICPEVCEKIKDFGVSYKTPYGKISSFWTAAGGKVTLKVGLPKGVGATVTLPCGVSEIPPEHTDEEFIFNFTL